MRSGMLAFATMQQLRTWGQCNPVLRAHRGGACAYKCRVLPRSALPNFQPFLLPQMGATVFFYPRSWVEAAEMMSESKGHARSKDARLDPAPVASCQPGLPQAHAALWPAAGA